MTFRLELAVEFARRWARDSLEELRKPNQSKEELQNVVYIFGEAAVVLDGDYSASSELDFFIDHLLRLKNGISGLQRRKREFSDH
jgi:hypothetical protein